MKTISVVTPCYNEELNIRDCYDEVRAVFERELPGYNREHIFCDNASTDSTVKILKEISGSDSSVRIIVNARNFGPLRNTFNGVMATNGDAVMLFVPADLQDPPELIPKFVRLWEEGHDIVYGIRAQREEGLLMRNIRRLYYYVLILFSEFQMPPGVGDFQLVDRRVVDDMRRIRDFTPFMRLMTFERGGRTIGVPYTWRTRKKGFSKNRFSALFSQGMMGVVSFTTAPIRVALLIGFAIALFSIAFALYNVVIGLLLYQHVAAPGILMLITALFFFGGVQLFFLGLIGEYILAIYTQTRERPIVFERERINFEAQPIDNPPNNGRRSTTSS